MSDITWGPAIEVNGVRPKWLADDVRVYKQHDYPADPSLHEDWQNLPAHQVGWDTASRIRLPVSHPAYLALANGFVPWGGGDEAPADWDEGEVLWATGQVMPAGDWERHHSYIAGRCYIIGYRRRTEQPAPAIAPELVERMIAFVRIRAFDGSKEAKAILAELEPADPDLELAKSIAGDVEAIALAIKAARENG